MKKPKWIYTYVHYTWTTAYERGDGLILFKSPEFFHIGKATEVIIKNNNLKTAIITNFIKISKKQYDAGIL